MIIYEHIQYYTRISRCSKLNVSILLLSFMLSLCHRLHVSFPVILSPCISRVARYTTASRRQNDWKIAVNTMSINYEHLLINSIS